jgi:glutathione S-transferase
MEIKVMMKLYMSGNSPYARRARLAIRGCGLLDQVEEIAIKGFDSLPPQSPGNKIPILITESGAVVTECILIGRYLNDLAGDKLTPVDSESRLECLAIESVASVLMDSLFARSMEKNQRNEETRSAAVLAKEAARSARCYDKLEEMLQDASHEIDFGSIAVIACLGYADWRNAEDEWRSDRPILKAFYDHMMTIPAFAETAPKF